MDEEMDDPSAAAESGEAGDDDGNEGEDGDSDSLVSDSVPLLGVDLTVIAESVYEIATQKCVRFAAARARRLSAPAVMQGHPAAPAYSAVRVCEGLPRRCPGGACTCLRVRARA